MTTTIKFTMNDLTLKEAALMIKATEDTITRMLNNLTKELGLPITHIDFTRTAVPSIGVNEEFSYEVQIEMPIK